MPENRILCFVGGLVTATQSDGPQHKYSLSGERNACHDLDSPRGRRFHSDSKEHCPLLHMFVLTSTQSSVSNTRLVTRLLHRYRAYLRLIESHANRDSKRTKVEKEPWKLNKTEAFILEHPQMARHGPLTPYLLRLVLPGMHNEAYFLNFQAPFLLYVLRFSLERLHRQARAGDPSVVWTFFYEQMYIQPGTPSDLVWRLLILPLAIVRVHSSFGYF